MILITAEQLARPVPGGIGAYVKGLVQGLMAEGTTPMLYTSRGSSQKLADLQVPIRESVWPLRAMVGLWDCGLLGAPSGFDVLHATSAALPGKQVPVPSLRTDSLPRASGKRATVTTAMVHDVAWRHFPQAFPKRGRKWHEAALHRAIGRVDVLFTPSLQTADDLLRDGVDHKRIEVVRLGADHVARPDDIQAKRRLDQLGVTGEFLLTVGTFEPRKNLERLLAAYQEVSKRLREPWPLIIVGASGWGPTIKPIENVLFAHNVGDRELSALYKRARLLAYVPLLEGFGLPVLEAMLFDTPVVSTNVPSAGEATYIVNQEDVNSIADGLLQVATDDALRSELVSRGRSHSAKFTWRACAMAHIDVWNALQ